jgi:hypothetical protein
MNTQLETYLNENVRMFGSTLIENWPTLQRLAVSGSSFDGKNECVIDGMKVSIQDGKWVVQTIETTT